MIKRSVSSALPARAVLPALLVMLVWVCCNRVPNATQDISSRYVSDVAVPYQRYSYARTVGLTSADTIELRGMRTCTLITNNTIDTIMDDSVVVRTTAGNDTIIKIDGQYYGQPRFVRADFNYAINNYTDIMAYIHIDTGAFAPELIRTALGAATVQQTAGCSTFARLPETLQNAVVAAFNEIKSDVHFSKEHLTEICAIIAHISDTGKTFYELLQQSYMTPYAAKEYAGLKGRGIFIDDNATLHEETLSAADRQRVEWFNITMLTTAIFREAFLMREPDTRRIKPRRTVVASVDTPHDSTWFISYIEPSDSAFYQRAYEDAGGLHAVAESLIIERSLSSDNEYPVALVFTNPLSAFRPTAGTVTGPEGWAVVQKKVDPDEGVSLLWNLYYRQYGTVCIDNAWVRIDGSMMLLQTLGTPSTNPALCVIKQHIATSLHIMHANGTVTGTKTSIEVEIQK